MPDDNKKPKIEFREVYENPTPDPRQNQRMFDEALVRTVIRVIRDNEDLRRELVEALGLED